MVPQPMTFKEVAVHKCSTEASHRRCFSLNFANFLKTTFYGIIPETATGVENSL